MSKHTQEQIDAKEVLLRFDKQIKDTLEAYLQPQVSNEEAREALEYISVVQSSQDALEKEGRISSDIVDAYILDFYEQHKETIKRALEELGVNDE